MTTAAVEFRDYNTLGDPSSGAYNPQKAGLRTLFGGYESILASSVSLTTYGGDPTGVAANDSAFAAAFAALGGNSGVIYIPKGTFKFNSQAVLTLAVGQSIAIIGGGQYSTILKWPNAAGGMQINYNGPSCAAQISDLFFMTSQANGGDALKLNQAGTLLGQFNLSTVSRCAFEGDDKQGAAAHYWTVGLNSLGVSAVNLNDSMFFGGASGAGGMGMWFAGTGTGAQYALVPNIRGCGFFSIGTGIRMGTYSQGMTISQCNFTNGVVGVEVEPGSVGLAQLAISDCQFDTTADLVQINASLANFSCVNSLFYCKAGHTGILGSDMITANIVGNQFGIIVPPGGFGIKMKANYACITGNTFTNLQTQLWLDTGSAFCSITGNVFQAFSTTASQGILVEGTANSIVGNQVNGFATGIVLSAASSLCNQQSNSIRNCTTASSNAGTGNTVGGGSA